MSFDKKISQSDGTCVAEERITLHKQLEFNVRQHFRKLARTNEMLLQVIEIQIGVS